uniref:Putative metalloprotease n=1 Tax=Ixodes ricinus TaxID=34613 RepID=A0A0K8R8P7_IXORI
MSTMRFLVFMLLFSGVYANAQPLHVGVFLATDFSFRSCSPYENESILQDYLEAFAGGVALYFRDASPEIKVSYIGSRKLTDAEERSILGIKGNESDITVKGADAIKALMEVTITEGNFLGSNQLFVILTGFNITEEETQRTINTNPATPGIDGSSEETYDEDVSISARSGSKKKVFQNVGGISQYGTICSMSGAIVQDYGSNFSGIPAAALQIASVLGPKYKGKIPRRSCPEYEDRLTTFDADECYKITISNIKEEDIECLEEPIENAKSDLITP